MEKKNLIKSGIAIAVIFAASMFGFQAAYGYGGSGGGLAIVSVCNSVTYGDWSACVNGLSYRNVLSQAPNYCQLTASQQAARTKTCGTQEVLGAQKYANGTLIRGTNKQIYVVSGTTLTPIKTLKQLANYAGKEILNVDDSVIASFTIASEDVPTVKRFKDGQLIRDHDVKVYVIINGKKKHILDLQELAKFYSGRVIHNISAAELAQY